MAYTWDEIESARTDASDPDLKRAHEIFDELKEKAEIGVPLNLPETFHFCDF